MNLLQDKWITVIRKNGGTEKIAPYQITDQIDSNPIVEIITPRPDFKGALYQFLIGLFQTVYAPKNETEWEDNFNTPPSPEDLKKETDKVAFAFDLFGEKIRFMQDVTIKQEKQEDLKWLLLDCNEEFFNKRTNLNNVCSSCSATALLTAQINSPAGGSGHRTSIRGGGPLSTLIRLDENNSEKNLWKNLYLNVLPEKSNLNDLSNIFLWVNSDNLISVLSSSMTNSDFDNIHSFWAMPRRIFLIENADKEIQCDVCGEASKINISKYTSKNHGCNYDKTWTHNLSPYKRDEKGELSALLCKNDSMLYNNWLSVITKTELTQPARVIHYFFEKRDDDSEQAIINSFGYFVKPGQAKTICWYEGSIPTFKVEHQIQKLYISEAKKFIDAAKSFSSKLYIVIEKLLCWKLKESDGRVTWEMPETLKANKQKLKDKWYNKPIFSSAKYSFFKNTETEFYKNLTSLQNVVKSGNDSNDLLNAWIRFLSDSSLRIFDEYFSNQSIEYEDIRKNVIAREELRKFEFSSQLKIDIGLLAAAKKKSTTQGAKKK